MPGARLELIDALGRHRIVGINRDPFTIGRSHSNSLPLTSAEISREHANIVHNGEDRQRRDASSFAIILLRDHDSRAGTFVNDQPITEVTLAHGDRIRIGRQTELTFLIGDASQTDDKTTASVGDLRQVAALLDGLRALGSAKVLDHVLALVIDSAIENARLYRESQEKARLDQELRTAHEFQQALLPKAAPVKSYFEAAAAMVPCRSIGGDFYEYLELEDGAFGFTLGDVAGKLRRAACRAADRANPARCTTRPSRYHALVTTNHASCSPRFSRTRRSTLTGAPAGLLGARVQEIFAAQAAPHPSTTVTRINDVLMRRALESRFVTLLYGVLAPDGQLTYCNAGHNPPLLLGGDGVRRLDKGGTLLGLFDDATFEEECVRLRPGDTLTVFSDGISEALNGAGEEFGDVRILDCVSAIPPWTDPRIVIDTLFSRVREFTVGEPQSDDMTTLVVRYRG